MNCKQVFSYLQERPAGDLWSRIESAEISSHLAICTECARVVKRHQQVAETLQLVQDPDCKPSTALDAAVIANYRRQMSESKRAIPLVSTPDFRPLAILAWSVAAAALVFAAILFFHPRREITKIAVPPSEIRTQSRPGQIAQKPATTEDATAQTRNVAARNKSSRRSVSSEPGDLPQEAFRSLMYCDELSCSDAMEMIRLQLPASFVTRPMPGAQPANGVVTADVLVGPDGIARGIRIEE